MCARFSLTALIHPSLRSFKCSCVVSEMASDPGNENEDNWLYGDSNPEPPEDPEISNDKIINEEPVDKPEPEVQDDNVRKLL